MPTTRIHRYFKHGTLTQMRVFEAVARLGSFTRAGEETHMAQPTVSVHMKKLSATIGVALVEQAGKRVRLTSAGEAVYAAVQTLFQTFTALDERLCDMAALKAGKLRIATTTAGEYLLPPLLAQFVKRHPGIEVSLHVGARQSVLERLARSEDDLYLLTNPPATHGLTANPILPNPLVALAPADHPLAGEKRISFQRFAHEPLLVREPGSGTRLATDQAFARHGMQPKISMELGSNESIKEAMLSGLGVSLLYRHSVGYDVEAGRLAVLEVEGLPHDGHWHFIHAPAKQLAQVAQTFVTFATIEAKRLFPEAGGGARKALPQRASEWSEGTSGL
jgi:DNA-binding transcriptional LysR family regulator